MDLQHLPTQLSGRKILHYIDDLREIGGPLPHFGSQAAFRVHSESIRSEE